MQRSLVSIQPIPIDFRLRLLRRTRGANSTDTRAELTARLETLLWRQHGNSGF